jgi:hypothetical protein
MKAHFLPALFSVLLPAAIVATDTPAQEIAAADAVPTTKTNAPIDTPPQSAAPGVTEPAVK